jgi:outer membrane protein assembly factor BamB/tetratricopeptide (TPR) repeat protein
MGTSELVKRGEKHLKKNQAILAARYLQLALEQGDDAADVHEMLARAYERVQDFDKAGVHFCEAAKRRIDEGNIEEAFRCMSIAAEMVPAADKVREQRLKLYLKYRPKYPLPSRGIVQEAISLSRKWVQDGRISEATELLRRLDQLEHGDITLKSEVIEVLLDQGMVNEAIAEYEKLGSYLVARGLYEDAKRVFKKILALDHTRIDVGDKLKKIDKLKKHRMSRRRRLVFLVVTLLVVAGAAVGYVQYADQAAIELRKILEGGEKFLRNADSIPILRSVSERFPLTPTAQDALDEIERIRQENADVAFRKSRAFEQQRKKAEESLGLAEQMVDEGRLDQALIHLQQAIDLAPDRGWIVEKELEGQKERLLTYLSEAEELYARSREALHTGGVAEAFQLTRRLYEDYSKSPFARGALLPVRVESRPAGAILRVAGTDQELETPCVVMVDPEKRCRLNIRHSGFEPEEIEISDPESENVSVLLSKLPRWSFETEGPIVGTPTAESGFLYVGSRDAQIYAVDPSGPTLLWKKKLSPIGDVESSISHDSKRLYVGSNDRFLYALDKHDGRILWKYASEGFPKSTPLVDDGRVYFGCSRGVLHCVDGATGALVWKRDLGQSILPGLFSSGESLLLATQDGVLHRVDRSTGASEVLFDADAETRSSLSWGGGYLFLGTEDGRLLAIDAAAGTVLWKVRTGAPVRGGATVHEGIVYFGSEDGTLRAARVDDGETLAEFQSSGRIRSTPLVHEGKVYFGATDHQVYCLDAGGLALEWRSRTGGSITASPFEVYGSIYVGSADHALYSYDP